MCSVSLREVWEAGTGVEYLIVSDFTFPGWVHKGFGWALLASLHTTIQGILGYLHNKAEFGICCIGFRGWFSDRSQIEFFVLEFNINVLLHMQLLCLNVIPNASPWSTDLPKSEGTFPIRIISVKDLSAQ